MEASPTAPAKAKDAPPRTPERAATSERAASPDVPPNEKVAWLQEKIRATLYAAETPVRTPAALLRAGAMAVPVVSALLLGLTVPGWETTLRYVAFGLNLLLIPLLAVTLLGAGQREAAAQQAVLAELRALLDELDYTARWATGPFDQRKVDALYLRYQALAARLR